MSNRWVKFHLGDELAKEMRGEGAHESSDGYFVGIRVPEGREAVIEHETKEGKVRTGGAIVPEYIQLVDANRHNLMTKGRDPQGNVTLVRAIVSPVIVQDLHFLDDPAHLPPACHLYHVIRQDAQGHALVAAGLSAEAAQQFLTAKAKEIGQTLSSDGTLVDPKEGCRYRAEHNISEHSKARFARMRADRQRLEAAQARPGQPVG
jgi:hypothetical protein